LKFKKHKLLLSDKTINWVGHEDYDNEHSHTAQYILRTLEDLEKLISQVKESKTLKVDEKIAFIEKARRVHFYHSLEGVAVPTKYKKRENTDYSYVLLNIVKKPRKNSKM
jgi:hypothetical protein